MVPDAPTRPLPGLKTRKLDLVIVGAGPAGLSLAMHLVALDPGWARRLVVVEAGRHPRPKLCGGGVTHYAECVLRRLGLSVPGNHVRVREAEFRHRESHFRIVANPLFRVFHRPEFDDWLAREARGRGIEILEEEPVSMIEETPGAVLVRTASLQIESRVLVGADGANSTVRRLLRWKDPTRLARLLEVRTPGDAAWVMGDHEGKAGFFFHEMSEGLQGYYWDFPMTNGGTPEMNRGVFDSRFVERGERPLPRRILEDALSQRKIAPKDVALRGHPIRWFHTRAEISRDRVLLVGDAAGADPLMGEGISFALGYGRPAALTIDRAFAGGEFSFSDYRDLLRREALFRHLRMRLTLAKFAYTPRPAWLTDALWKLTGGVAKLTPWSDPGFEPLKGRRAKKYLR